MERAARGIALNGLADQVHMMAGDVREMDKTLKSGSFDVAVCNPPYRPLLSGRGNPERERLQARHEVEGGLVDFLRSGAALLRHRGRMCLVYPSERVVELFSAMRQHNLEPRRVRFVQSFADVPAYLVLVEGTKGAGASLTALPPLFIYRCENEYTEEMAGWLKG